MTILNEIIQYKYKEVAERKRLCPVKQLERRSSFTAPVISMKEYIQRADKSGIITEIKRMSPSKGVINANVSVERIAVGYEAAGASAISVLTDEKFFGGSIDDLLTARQASSCPILRKEFIVDEYQIVEAKSIGADAILLIAAALTSQQINAFTKSAHGLGLEVLLEVHNEDELLANQSASVDMMGVNNRDLKTFTLDVNISRTLSEKIPDTFVRISESGIENPETIIDLKKYGYQGFLMGQNFMQHEHPELACGDFIRELKNLEAR